MAGNRRSGRRRLPTAVHRARGTEVRHDPAHEPTAPSGMPPRPPHLDGDAALAWDTIGRRLLDQRVLTTAHSEGLALLADAWAQYLRLQRDFAALGHRSVLVQEWATSDGRIRTRVVENPLCRQLRQQALLLNTLFGEFGQTPASAPKVHVADSGDPLEAFLATPANVVPFPRPKRSAR